MAQKRIGCGREMAAGERATLAALRYFHEGCVPEPARKVPIVLPNGEAAWWSPDILVQGTLRATIRCGETETERARRLAQ